jgi:hypothetical protein
VPGIHAVPADKATPDQHGDRGCAEGNGRDQPDLHDRVFDVERDLEGFHHLRQEVQQADNPGIGAEINQAERPDLAVGKRALAAASRASR